MNPGIKLHVVIPGDYFTEDKRQYFTDYMRYCTDYILKKKATKIYSDLKKQNKKIHRMSVTFGEVRI